MCLVLGCPGSGCSTFLKTIANQREGYARVSGDVVYAGMSAAEMGKYYKGEVVYNEEGMLLWFHLAKSTNVHCYDRRSSYCHLDCCADTWFCSFYVSPHYRISRLTLMHVSLPSKTPGPNGRLPGLTKTEFNEEVMGTLLKMLNMTHTAQTLVGDEFVRGVSGGERKRVSIAEMMVTRARVQSWDNSTRGLDASTALDFNKSLRIMTDVLGQTTFVSLYQAGEGMCFPHFHYS